MLNTSRESMKLDHIDQSFLVSNHVLKQPLINRKRTISFLSNHGKLIEFEWTENAPVVSVSQDARTKVKIRSENLPREFFLCQSLQQLQTFVQDTVLYLKQIGTGDLRLHVHRPLRGGLNHLDQIEAVYLAINQVESMSASSDVQIGSSEDEERLKAKLSERNIVPVDNAGEGLDSLINALFQHGRGCYLLESISDLKNIKDFVCKSERSDEYNAQKMLKFIKRQHQHKLNLTIIQADSLGNPIVAFQTGEDSQYHVVVWKKGNKYLSLVPSTFYSSIVQESNPSVSSSSSTQSSPSSSSASSSSQVGESHPSQSQNTEFEVSYQEAFTFLKLEMLELANPILYQDIMNALQIVIDGPPIDSQIGFIHSFDKIDMPVEMRKQFHELNSKWCAECSSLTIADQLEKKEKQLIVDLRGLIKAPKTLVQLWPELKALLSLPEVKKIDNAFMKDVIEQITSSKSSERAMIAKFRTSIPNKIKETGGNLDVLQALLAEQSTDLSTMISQAIRQIPKEEEGLLTYRSRNPEIFQDKKLYLTDPNTWDTYDGIITAPWKDPQNGDLHLVLEKGVKTVILRNHAPYISVKINTDYLLLEALKGGTFPIRFGQSVWIDVEIVGDLFDQPKIMPGRYLIKQIDVSSEATWDPRTWGRTKPVKQFELFLSGYSSPSYLIAIKKEKIHNEEISTLFIKNCSSGNREKLSWVDLKRYQATTSTFKDITGILPANQDRHFRVADEIDPNALKALVWKQIREKIGELRQFLLTQERRPQLNEFICRFVANKLTEVSFNFHSDPVLFEKLKYLKELYKEVEVTETEERILTQAVKDANYSIMTNKVGSVLIATTMELLSLAFVHINNMAEKDLILFIGNTGSGKSTSVSYLLNAELESFSNDAGDKVYRVKKTPESSNKAYPNIGQALGTSETLYTQGYSLPEIAPLLMLGDAPGFQDTRGSDYELCTNMSIDQTIRSARQIKSAVIVIPFESFRADRATPAVSLISSLQELFRGFLRENKELDKDFFILVTKWHSAPPEAVDKFGARLSILVDEVDEEIRKLQNQGGENHAAMTNFTQRREMWRGLRAMYNAGRIDFIDLEDKADRNTLLKKYSRSLSGISKSQYVSLMETPQMRQKFGNHIEESTHTWSKILTDYFVTIPTKISGSKDKIFALRQEIMKEEEEKKARADTISRKENLETVLKDGITQLEKALTNSNENDLSDELKIQLQEMIRESNKKGIQQIEEDIQGLNVKLTGKDDELIRNQEEIIDKEKEIARLAKKIKSKEAKIKELKKGYYPDVLYERTYTAGQILKKLEWKAGVSKESVWSQGRGIDSSDYNDVGSETGAERSRRKVEFIEIVEISRDYRLVPADPEERRKFQDINTNTFGSFTATVEMKGYRWDLGRKVDTTCKKVIYSFIQEWKGDGSFPSLKITHLIPYSEKNYSTINNKTTDIESLKKQIRILRTEINGSKKLKLGGLIGKKEEILVEIDRLNASLSNKYIEKAGLERTLTSKSVQKLLKEQRAGLKCVQTELSEWRESKEIETRIAARLNEIDVEKQKKRDDRLDQLKLAVIIKTQFETVKLIRKFVSLITPGVSGPSSSSSSSSSSLSSTVNILGAQEQREGLQQACLKFTQLYDQYEHEMIGISVSDLSVQFGLKGIRTNDPSSSSS